MKDRLELLKIAEASEETLGASRITDWLGPEFFTTRFWFMWATTFAFQPWHSAVEFKRYLHRFIKEFSRIETLAGVKRTIFNQYDLLVRPLEVWLQQQGVHILKGCTVTDLDLETAGGKITVTGLQYLHNGETGTVAVRGDDLIFLQNASMTDASSLGSMTTAPKPLTKKDSNGWAIWEKLARLNPEFGNPAAFNSSIPEFVLGVVHGDAPGFDLLRQNGGLHRQQSGHRRFGDVHGFQLVDVGRSRASTTLR